MDHEAEVIKQQMEQTRSALAEKLENLEEHVAATVRSTTDAVSDTVETVKGAVEGTVHSVENSVEAVKETVSESVETVKETFNLNRQMQERPWLMMGGGVVVGYFAGCLLTTGVRQASAVASHWGHPSVAPPPTANPSTATASSAAQESYGNERGWFSSSSFAPSAQSGPSTWDKVSEALGPTAEKVKGMAIGAAAGLVGNMILQAVPPNLRNEVEQVINEFTQAVGGKPLPDFLHGNWAQSRSSGASARP